MAAKDRSTDRHARNPVCARLDSDDDARFRSRCKQLGMSTYEGVKAAIRAWLPPSETTSTDTTAQGENPK
jgi:hypothetical protein